MLLSFSVPVMRPWIVAGLQQRLGVDVGDQRVKRQTMRRYGPRAEKLLAHDPIGHSIPHDLHLWWKSRTAERALLGIAKQGQGDRPIRIYALDIWHTFIAPTRGARIPCIRINGPRGWRDGDAVLFWSPGDSADCGFAREAHADGFDSPEAFRDFFVPNMGDRFGAILIKW
jgi:hypothetical protein